VPSLRSRLGNGEVAYGLWVTLESAAVTEIAAELGLDWVCIDMEHGHLGFREVLDHLRAARGSETSALVRVPALAPADVKRALDLGADGVIVPLVESAADVENALAYSLYPPRGRRGIGGERAVRWGLRQAEYLARANEDVLVVPIIETAAATRAIGTILDIPGLDAVFFGPADLSASIDGRPGAWEGAGVAELIADIKDQALARGIVPGIVATGRADAARRRDEGFRMIALGSDASLLINQIRDTVEALT